MKKIIGLDLDEVLAETINYSLQYHNYQIAGKKITREAITHYYLHNIEALDISIEDTNPWYRTPLLEDHECNISPVLGVREKLLFYKEQGYLFTIITARQSEILGEYTQKWVEKHYPNLFERILFANHFTKADIPKSQLCKNHGIEIMVEDNFDYALDLAKNGIYTFLLEKPWNIHIVTEHPNIKKVKSWEEIHF